MDRGAWRAAVHGVARVGHDLATKPPPLWGWGEVKGIHSASPYLLIHFSSREKE